MDIMKKCQPHLWLLTGTREGYVFAEYLLKIGWRITVSVVSKRASIKYEKLSLENIFIGPLMGLEEIRNIILKARKNNDAFSCVVDITHPFAIQITPNLSKICKELDQPFIRYERSISNPSNGFLLKVLSDIAEFDLKNKSILLALGVKRLQEAIDILNKSGAQAFTRVLANPDSLKMILSTSILKRNFAVLNPLGSSDGKIEKALIRKWRIYGVICRQSGGENEMLWHQICSEMDIKLWLLERPKEFNCIDSVDNFEKLRKRLDSIKMK